MKFKAILCKSLGLAAIAAGLAILPASTGWAQEADPSEVRDAIAQYETPALAQAAGWDLVEGLDNCFDNPGTGAMGVHYIDADRLDTTVDELAPEAIIYETSSGSPELVAVEYIVPAADWDAEGHDGLPEALGQTFHLNEALGVYVLHAWLFKENPAGMFEDWNPDVSCPAVTTPPSTGDAGLAAPSTSSGVPWLVLGIVTGLAIVGRFVVLRVGSRTHQE
jgi:hypothetical protein